VYEAVNRRRSVRAYAETPVPEESLKRILEAARLSPSASNRQPWYFIVVTDSEKRKIISQGRYAKFVTQSPVVVVGCADKTASPKWSVVDVSIALENIVLTATGEGLGTCWIGGFIEEDVKHILEIPEKYDVIAIISVGYPLEKLDVLHMPPEQAHTRKSLQEIVGYEKYGQILRNGLRISSDASSMNHLRTLSRTKQMRRLGLIHW
jgi:nitroreductase